MAQTKKPEIEKLILSTAKKLFLDRGFLKTSLREIAKLAGITLSNLYNYFEGKDGLFTAVLKPQLDDLERLCEFGRKNRAKGGPFETLQQKKKYLHIALQYIIKNRKELNLLFNLSSSSKLENYKAYLVDEYCKNWQYYFEDLYKRYPNKKFNKPSDFFLKNMANLHLTTISTLIRHKYTQNEMEQYAHEMAIFLWHGGLGLIHSHTG